MEKPDALPYINSSRKPGTPHEKTALERRIEATDGQIDGGPALWADGRGDRDCGGGEQVVLYSFPAFRIRAIKWR
ncbi:MAG: hypothetical protein NTX42_01595 [Methanothrix sp.]|nr:hypothetical protein [Methanothrix sp.]